MSASNATLACPTCGGAGTIESEEPFVMMSAVPCPACSPLTVGIGHSTSLDHCQAKRWNAFAESAAGWSGFPRSGYLNCADLMAFKPDCYAYGLSDFEFENGLCGLSLFARFMAFVAAQEAPQATNPPRSCATCSRPLNAWQLRFDGGAELRCGRDDCGAKDKLVATREVQADGTIRETEKALAEVECEEREENAALVAGISNAWKSLESPLQDLPRSETDPEETATNQARAPLDLAALRTLAREARGHDAAFHSTDAYSIEDAVAFLNLAVGDRIALASAVEQLADALEAKTPPRAQLDAALGTHEEWIAGRFWGAINVEGDDPTPVFLFPVEADAWAEIRRRNALPEEDDDHLSDHYQALSFDVEAIFWNSFEPNPRPAPTESRLWKMQREIERLKAQRGLTSEEMAIIEQTRAIVRGRDELRASVEPLDREALGRRVREIWIAWAQTQPNRGSRWLLVWEEMSPEEREVDRLIGETIAREAVEHLTANLQYVRESLDIRTAAWNVVRRMLDAAKERIVELSESIELLDAEGRKMKAERDAALLEVAALKLALGASRSAFADGEAHERRKRDATIERLQSDLDTARAEIERMKPLVEAALKWDEEGASDDELLQAAQDYRDAEEGAP